MIFFSNFDFKRLYVSKHILIDGTYVFPSGFVQTIIILYYDYIVFKFIPSIYILINNKITIGNEHAFRDIKEYIIKYKSKNKEELQWETYTSDFELALTLWSKQCHEPMTFKYGNIFLLIPHLESIKVNK